MIFLAHLLTTVVAVGGPAIAWIMTRPKGSINFAMVDEIRSKLQHLDLATLQSWVDQIQGITHDQRLGLLSKILGTVNQFRNENNQPTVLPFAPVKPPVP